MAGPLSPIRRSVPATSDPNRLGFPFCQPSGVRSHEDLHRPLSNTLPITVRKSRSKRRMSSAPAAPLVDASHTTDGWKSLDTEHPTYVSACRSRSRRRFLALRPRWRRCLCPARPGRVLWYGGLRGLCRDPERGSGRPDPYHDRRDRRRWRVRITPVAMVRLCGTGQAILDDIARCGLSPTGPKAAASMVTSAPDAT